MISIRPYDSQDREVYLALIHRVFGEPAPQNDPAQTLDRVLAVESSVVVVSEVGGQVVGAATGGYDGCRGWLYSIAVDNPYRRQGLGARLVASVEDHLFAMGCPKINLQVRAENEEVVAFYESLGYVIEPRVSMGKRARA